MKPKPRTDGFTAPGFEGVATVFDENFAKRGDSGAAFAAVYEGRTVVDLWGGSADRANGRPWSGDTLAVIFSGTKGLVAVCLAMLVDRELLDPDAPVCSYWPEFAAEGKAHVRVSDVASHQSRLPGIYQHLTHADMLDAQRMAALLAAQRQDPDRRSRDTYHALTFGWLCGELIRSVDGRSAGTFLAEEIAGPLGLDIWIGLPDECESRTSRLHYADNWGSLLHDDEHLATDEFLARVRANPSLFPRHELPWNSREFHAAEIPAAGGIGTARSIARLYGCLADDGEIDGIRLLSPAAIARARSCICRRRDALTHESVAYGLGFELQTEARVLGPPDGAFGHSGAGGSVHGAWPHERVGFSYCMNELRDDAEIDARPKALLDALHAALRGHQDDRGCRSGLGG